MTLGSQLGLESNVLTEEIEKQGRLLNLADLVNMHHAILGIQPLPRADAIYLVTMTPDNEESIFQGAKKLYDGGISDRVWILDGPNHTGYPGFDAWSNGFSRYVPEAKIERVDFDKSINLNTYSEAQALVRHAKKEGIRTLYIVATQFHMLRAFMTIASEAVKEYPELRIYPFFGSEQRWDQEILHSQGKERNTRRGFVIREMEKIVLYQGNPQFQHVNPKFDITNPTLSQTAVIIEYAKRLGK